MSRASKMVGLAAVAAVMSAIAVFAMPADTAEAHIRVVTPPSGVEVEPGWVGPLQAYFALEDQSAALDNVPDIERFEDALFSAHSRGLNAACEANESNDTVDIFGPPTPAGCPHGT